MTSLDSVKAMILGGPSPGQSIYFCWVIGHASHFSGSLPKFRDRHTVKSSTSLKDEANAHLEAFHSRCSPSFKAAWQLNELLQTNCNPRSFLRCTLVLFSLTSTRFNLILHPQRSDTSCKTRCTVAQRVSNGSGTQRKLSFWERVGDFHS